MASGKLSPRQKMINLMYLIFIAMLAIQIGPEVLSSFGYMNEKLTEANITATGKNNAILENLALKSKEQPEKYLNLYNKANSVNDLSDKFGTYLENLKNQFTKDLDDKKDYEAMAKTNIVDEYFFEGDYYTKAGQGFLNEIESYRTEILNIVGENSPLISNVNKRFDTPEQETKSGKQKWLNNRYEGFPLISTVTNLTSLQTDIKTTQSEIFGSLLGDQLEIEVSMTKYEAIVIPDKTAFFQGETFKGKVVLGKVDPTLKPESVSVNGNSVSKENIQEGQVLLEFPAGGVGEREIKGKFVFMENGEPLEIPIESSYAVIPKPNSAVISADKMNVVYRGVSNPMTISIPGIPDNLVTASAPGLRRGSGSGKYIMIPASGREVTIRVNGKLSDGSPVSSSQTFRIKDIPSPSGTIRKQAGLVKMPKTSLGNATVGVALLDFDFDLALRTTGFTLKVPGQSSVVVRGNKMNAQAKKAINKAKRGDVITIFNIKSAITGNSTYRIKPSSPVSIEIQ